MNPVKTPQQVLEDALDKKDGKHHPQCACSKCQPDLQFDGSRLDSINRAVIDKLRQRAMRGHQKYGVTMDRNDLTELQWLVHVQEEILDAAVYLEKLIQEKQKV